MTAGPLHYLLIREIVMKIPGATGSPERADPRPVPTLVDLGCGTGAAGAAWAEACAVTPQVVGVDIHPWALTEAAWTYREFGFRAKTERAAAAAATLPKSPALILAAFTVNELSDDDRAKLLPRLIERASRGDRVLIVEPLARSAAPWWGDWAQAFRAAGGRADEWRLRVDLPPLVAKLDRAAGLNHRDVTGRSLFL